MRADFEFAKSLTQEDGCLGQLESDDSSSGYEVRTGVAFSKVPNLPSVSARPNHGTVNRFAALSIAFANVDTDLALNQGGGEMTPEEKIRDDTMVAASVAKGAHTRAAGGRRQAPQSPALPSNGAHSQARGARPSGL